MRLSLSKERESNLELLRIIAMVLIVAGHCAYHGAGNDGRVFSGPFSMNFCSAVALGSWGQLGVYLYVIISSWFLCDKQGIHFKKVILLTVQSWTISFAFFVAFCFVNFNTITPKVAIVSLLTPVYGTYWFATTYLAFYITMPILQYIANRLNDSSLGKVSAVLLILIPVYNYLVTNVGNSWADFIAVFFVVSYLKRKKGNWIERHGWLFPVFMAFIALSEIILKLLLSKGFLNRPGAYVALMQRLSGRTFLMLITALFAFYFFKNLKLGHSRFINTVSQTTFGVYLIHENYFLSSANSVNGRVSILWDRILGINSWYSRSNFYGLYFLGCVILVFCVCSVMEMIRQQLVDRLMIGRIPWIKTVSRKIDAWYVLKPPQNKKQDMQNASVNGE